MPHSIYFQFNSTLIELWKIANLSQNGLSHFIPNSDENTILRPTDFYTESDGE